MPVEQWRPIETHDHSGQKHIVALADGRVGEAAWHGEWGWRWTGASLKMGAIEPTHWMPLPAPPKADDLDAAITASQRER